MQAFQRVKDDDLCAVENCYYEIIREDRIEEALQHIAEHNFPDEIIFKSLGITMDEEVKAMCTSALQDNMSIALISSLTGEIVGLRVIRIGSRDDKFDPEKIKSQAFRKAMGLYEYKNENFNAFKHYGVDEAIEFFGISVHKDHRRKGIGLKIMQAALLLISSMRIGTVVAKGDCDSNYSKCIYERLGFDILGEIMFDEYKVNGEIVISNTGEHKSLKAYGKIIRPEM